MSNFLKKIFSLFSLENKVWFSFIFSLIIVILLPHEYNKDVLIYIAPGFGEIIFISILLWVFGYIFSQILKDSK